MKNKATTLLIGFLLLFLLFQLFILNKARTGTDLLYEKYGDITDLKIVSLNKKYELEAFGESLSDTVSFLSVSEPVLSGDVLKGHNTLLYYFSTEYCDMCIKSQLDAMRMVFGNKTDKIVILASSYNYKDILIYRDLYNLDCPVFKVEAGIFPILDDLKMPYFLMIDNDMRVMNAFVPLKEKMGNSITYLKSAKKYLYPDQESVYTSVLDGLDFDNEIRLGKIKVNEETKFAINVTNRGDDLVVLNVISDCDCTVVEDEVITIGANNSIEIRASLTPSKEGAFQKFIYIQTDSSEAFRAIEIKGEAVCE